jgi:Rps23 Pro-64 3,4-dihydroxylase Tpa1-like proline 4-hydroxylase
MNVVSSKALNFSPVEVFSEPFPYFLSPEAFSDDVSLDILHWLEKDAPWKLVETNFYEQYEFSMADARLPDRLSFLREDFFLDDLKSNIEGLFQVCLVPRIDLTAHKLIPGQRIRIHNDFISGQETHRLLLQFNHGWNENDGGFLLFFNSADSADIHRIFAPTHNSAIGFAITPHSHHAVSLIRGGERYTLVYSFYSNEEK